MWVRVTKENLQIYLIKMNLFKYFELYVHAYTSDHFNVKSFWCSEPPQADSREGKNLGCNAWLDLQSTAFTWESFLKPRVLAAFKNT